MVKETSYLNLCPWFFIYCSLPHPPAPHPPAPPPLAFFIQTDAIFLQSTVWSHVSPHWKHIKLGLKWGINQHCRIRGCEIPIKFVTKFSEKRYSSTLLGYPTHDMRPFSCWNCMSKVQTLPFVNGNVGKHQWKSTH